MWTDPNHLPQDLEKHPTVQDPSFPCREVIKTPRRKIVPRTKKTG